MDKLNKKGKMHILANSLLKWFNLWKKFTGIRTEN